MKEVLLIGKIGSKLINVLQFLRRIIDVSEKGLNASACSSPLPKLKTAKIKKKNIANYSSVLNMDRNHLSVLEVKSCKN